MFVTYVLQNTHNRKLYIGQTNNLEERLKRHNSQIEADTKSYTYKQRGNGIWVCIYSKSFRTRAEAMKREKQLKSFRGRQYIKNLLK